MKNVLKFKFIGLFIFSMFIFSNLQAQSEAKVGIRAGVLFSNQDFKNGGLDINTKAKLGLDVALVADFPVGEVLNISPEFHWLQKGAKIEDISGDDITATFNYLEVPVLVKFKFGTDVGFSVFAGPSFGYLIDASKDISLNDYKKIEIGIHAGAGIALGPLVIDLRYLYGISNISDNEIEVRNNGLGAGVSLMF
ncbi:MAG: PorT family protein [Saprospiraceae bacterium]|uniref:PorT family protein n=1 Tax=Candidatus Opimibacter skivensis TaxID=2982028 RepID=A0A9D7SV16_9BACT|nr:PorT family protein [Candidatus Opimibacter skivensis]